MMRLYKNRFYRIEAGLLLAASVLAVALGAPLLVMARETSRENVCANHLRKLAAGCLDYARSHEATLPSNRKQPYTGWNTLILPHIQQQALYEKYDPATDWWSAKNRQVGATHLPGLVCPAAPANKRMLHLLDPDGGKFKAAATDYVASAGAYLYRNKSERLFRGAMASPGRYYGGSKVEAKHAVRLSEITDGTSNTLLIVEMAGKPQEWRAGKLHAAEPGAGSAKPLVNGFSFGQWIAPNWAHLRSWSKDGATRFGPCGVNCSNSGSIYSFHPQLANAAMADGSVRRLKAGLPQEIMVSLVSIADGEIVSREDYESLGGSQDKSQ